MARFLLLCLLLCSIGPGLAGWNGYGKGWGQQHGSRSDYNKGYQKGNHSGSFGKGAWEPSYTWEAGYVAAMNEANKKRYRKKKPASSSDVTPESTPEKPKSSKWKKVKSELEELRNFKNKIEKDEIEKAQEQRMADLEQRLTSRLDAAKMSSAASSTATKSHDGGKDQPLNKVQQNLAARLLNISLDDNSLVSWDEVEKTIDEMEGREVSGALKREGLAVPKANKDRQKALHSHLWTQLGLEVWMAQCQGAHPWMLLLLGIILGWVFAVCFSHASETSFLPPLVTSVTRYFSAVVTIWRDEVGIGRLFESAGIPLTTAAGASLTLLGRSVMNSLIQHRHTLRDWFCVWVAVNDFGFLNLTSLYRPSTTPIVFLKIANFWWILWPSWPECQI